MTDQMKELKIDPEFEQVIPPLTKDEYHQLEENILADGKIMMPIALWGDTIVDGHNRYRIACEHGDIPYTTTQLDFDNRHEAVAWICKNQLGRRNLSDEQRVYLLGKRYAAEKQIEKLRDESGRFVPCGQNDPEGEANERRRTSERIAQEIGKSEKHVRRAEQYAQALDLADNVCPGVKDAILNGVIKPTNKEVVAILKADKDALPDMIDELRGIEKSDEIEQEEAESPRPPIEDSIARSMLGTVNMFIESFNDFFSRFPKFITDPVYMEKTKFLIGEMRRYLNDVENALPEESQTANTGQ